MLGAFFFAQSYLAQGLPGNPTGMRWRKNTAKPITGYAKAAKIATAYSKIAKTNTSWNKADKTSSSYTKVAKTSTTYTKIKRRRLSN